MAGKNNVFNNNDSMDINELAALNDDISDDFIAQLSAQLSENMGSNEDGAMFEEPAPPEVPPETDAAVESEDAPQTEEPLAETPEVPKEEAKPEPKKEEVKLDESFDDNFIKKYKAKLNKQTLGPAAKEETVAEQPAPAEESIEKVSQGNITEKAMTPEQIEYNDSLDFLDGNVKYSKYVIYVDPQNVDFIESLTVKERKNLINGILKQQGDIALTKQRFKIIQSVMMHIFIAVLTVAFAIPILYYVINASLEATIDNHRQSQTIWQTLYRENGKITAPKN